MNAPVFLESARSYVTSQTRDSRAPWGARSATVPFITLSREAGSGGASLARLLARRLDHEASADAARWSVFDDNLTPEMLKQHGLPTRFARFLPEDRVSEINASIGELVGLHPSLYDLVQKTNVTLRDLATRGHVVLVGRGANFATRDLAHGLHVRLVAPAADRARYLAHLYNLTAAEAQIYNAKCDAARRRYVKAYFDADVAAPDAYDLVLNTGRMPLDEAAKLICALVRARFPAAG